MYIISPCLGCTC